MRILALIAIIVLATSASFATEPDLAKLAGARAGEYVLDSHAISGFGPGVWGVKLAGAPSLRNGWCTTRVRSVYASNRRSAKLKFPFSAAEDSLAAFDELPPAECKGEPKGRLVYIDEAILPHLSETRALLDRSALDRFAAESHCSRYFPAGSAGLSFDLRAVRLDRDMVNAILFHGGIQMRVWFPIADGKLDPSAAKSSCTRMSDIVN